MNFHSAQSKLLANSTLLQQKNSNSTSWIPSTEDLSLDQKHNWYGFKFKPFRAFDHSVSVIFTLVSTQASKEILLAKPCSIIIFNFVHHVDLFYTFLKSILKYDTRSNHGSIGFLCTLKVFKKKVFSKIPYICFWSVFFYSSYFGTHKNYFIIFSSDST